jgi:hypothetical protein
VEELIPIGLGLLLGVGLGRVRPSRRLATGALLAVAAGAVSTYVAGEAAISWGFVLFDIPIVGLVAVVVRRVVARIAVRRRAVARAS